MARPASSGSSSDGFSTPSNRWSTQNAATDPNDGETRLREVADTYIPQALDKLESSVATVKRLTTDRAVTLIGYTIFGLALGVAACIALIGILLITVRLADVYGPGPLWAWYLGFAGVFLIAGVLLWRRSLPRSSTDA